MNLQLNLVPMSGRGRAKKPVEHEVVRALNPADIQLLSTTELGTAPTELQRITDRHHSLARLLASGTTEWEASLIVGYSAARISTLKNSPAFQELLAIYGKEVDHQFQTSLEHMAGLSRDALLVLRERIEDEPEKFTTNELRGIITDMIDRTEGDPSDKTRLPDIVELIAPSMVDGPVSSDTEDSTRAGAD